MIDTKIVSIWVVIICSNLCYSMIVPFLPIEMEKFGVQKHLFGYIFGIYALASMIGSLVVGKLLIKYGRKIMFILGIISMGIAMASFSLISYINNINLLVLACLLWRWLQGISSSMIQTTSYSIISACYPNEQKKYLSIIEISMGIGLTIGPGFGALLYSFFKFEGTFILTGVVFLLLSPLLYIVIPNLIDIRNGSEEETWNEVSTNDTNGEKASYFNLFMNLKYVFNWMVAFLAYFHWVYFEPLISVYLSFFGLETIGSGLVYSLSSFGYMFANLFMVKLSGRYSNRILILWGLLGWAISHFLIGPAHFVPNSLVIIWTGMFLNGCFASLVIIPTLPEMTSIASINFPNKMSEVTDFSLCIFWKH